MPHSLLAHGHYLYVVETNHNSVLRVDPKTGTISRVYDLSLQDPAPIVLARQGNTYYLGGFDGLIQTFGHRFGAIQTFDEGFRGASWPLRDATEERWPIPGVSVPSSRRKAHAQGEGARCAHPERKRPGRQIAHPDARDRGIDHPDARVPAAELARDRG